MSVKKSIILRVRIAFLLMALFGLLIVLKIGVIQFVKGDELRDKAKTSSFKEREVPANRGNIYADDGSLLATSLPYYNLAFDPTTMSNEDFEANIDSFSICLSELFKDKTPEKYEQYIRDMRASGDRYKRWSHKINYHEKKELSKLPVFRLGRYRGGVIFEKHDNRDQPFSYLALRTIGGKLLEKKDTVDGEEVIRRKGLKGIEFSFEKELAGTNGFALFQKVSDGWVPVSDNEHTKPVNGLDVYTTLDINIQDVADNSLKKILRENDAKYGSVIVMEVKTGEIKAMVNLTRTSKGEYWERLNYAVQGNTDPGSTFKLASMIALFEERGSKLKLSDTINCFDGRYPFHDAVMTDAKPGGYGILSVKDAMAKSSNIGVSRLVMKYFQSNPQRFIDYLYDMGLNDTLGFQLKGEAKPFIKKFGDDSWSGTTLPWSSIGYEMRLTPLQVLTLYNAVANNGVKIKPIIVKELRRDDEVVARYETEVLNNKICSRETLTKVKAQLEAVVEEGTAKNIKTKKYKIAGKTGTAQKVDPKTKKYTQTYSTSFAGYFPADKPKYSCIVVVDSPQGFNRQGSNVAAPVFREIADKIYSRDLVLHKEEKLKRAKENGVFPVIRAGHREELKYLCDRLKISTHQQGDETFVKTDVEHNAVNLIPKKEHKDLVPDVTGLRLKDALYMLENKGLIVRFSGKGRVVKQSVYPGKLALKDSEIYLTLEE